jgi:hypothetical protein
MLNCRTRKCFCTECYLQTYKLTIMGRLILCIAFSLLCFISSGQTDDALSKVRNVSQAKAFIKANPNTGAKLFTINSGIDTTEILIPLYGKKAGFTFRIDDVTYKILEVDSTLSFRASYIYLDGGQLTRKQVDSLRKEIISQYKAGTSFFDLVQLYNMDGNITGDTKWFAAGQMVKEFESAVRSHRKNDIFTVNTPGQNWYHVVLKTFDDTFIKTVTLIRAKSINGE